MTYIKSRIVIFVVEGDQWQGNLVYRDFEAVSC